MANLSRDEKNAKVYQAWANNQAANGSPNRNTPDYQYDSAYQTRTDGRTLWSYAMIIGGTNANGEKVLLIPSWQVVTVTTNKHINDAWRYSDRQVYGMDNGLLKTDLGSDFQDRIESRPNMSMRFPTLEEVGVVFTIRCERKTWKTRGQAMKAMQKLYPESLIHDVLPVYPVYKYAERLANFGESQVYVEDSETVWTIGHLVSYVAEDTIIL